MPEATYEILALMMRYVFVALSALICLLSFGWLLREHRAHARERRQLPRAGQIGVFEFADTGERIPLAPEGLVGAGRGCDVVIPRRGLRARQFSYRFQPRRGVEIVPCRGAQVTVNGQKAQAGYYALSGALVRTGDVTLRLRLLKRLRLPSQTPDSPDPLLSAWEEDDFLPNGVAVPAPAEDGFSDEDGFPDEDTPPDEDRGKLLKMPLFSDDPPEDTP